MARAAGEDRDMTPLQARARQLLATALAIEASQLADDAAIGLTEEWDSLAHMRLVAAIESALGREISAEAIVALASLDDVERTLAEGG
jgi:acyl carrier protein